MTIRNRVNGSGFADCYDCAGSGTMTDPSANEAEWLEGLSEVPCPFCDGNGWLTALDLKWAPDGAEVATQVQRIASVDGYAIIRVWAHQAETGADAHPGIEVVVSPKGRSLRVFDWRTGKELQ